jgi:hypothetical protein
MYCPGVSRPKMRRFSGMRRILAKDRIGPHNKDVIDTLIGSLLGDSWAEKRNNSVRFVLHYSSKNVDYLNYLHKFFASREYTSPSKPRAACRIGKNRERYFSIKFRTFSYTSLCYIYDLFYVYDKSKKLVKIVPHNIHLFLTPKVLAIWLMNDGTVCGTGVKISVKCATNEGHLEILQDAILSVFNIKVSFNKRKDNFVLYFTKKDLPRLRNIVMPFFLKTMLYKLHFKL